MKNSKQLIAIGIGAIVLLGGAYFVWNQSKPQAQTVISSSGQVLLLPTRTAEINGTVLQIEGNEVMIKRVISSLSAEEQAEKKAKMQSLSVEERQALRGQDSATAQTEDITVIIPVGIPIVVGTGDMSGSITESSLGDIKVGGSLSIWKTDTGIEMVKIKGL